MDSRTDREEESMKTTMRKTAAYLLAMLLIFQMLPAFADGTESNTVHPITDYRDKLDITAVTKTLTVGMEITLTVNENYEKVVWSSQDEGIATVDQNGVVTGISEGKVKITAAEDGHSDSITLLVVAAAASSEQGTPAEGNGKPEEKSETPREEMVIFINGEKQRIAYDGTEHVNVYSATSNRTDFTAGKLHLTEEGEAHLAHATNGGVAYDELTEADFYYDSDEAVTFVITNGWLQIRPATLNIYVNDATKYEGDPDPAFSADLEGLKGNDTAESIDIQYSVTEDNRIVPNVAADDMIGNYRVGTVMAGKLTVIGMKEYPLYNLARFSDNKDIYYRLAKTTISTTIMDITKKYGYKLKAEEYQASEYDFTDLVITDKDNIEYVYFCDKNADKIAKGANYYKVSLERVEICKQKIGAMNGSTPRWMVPESQRYNDPNKTDSIHRNYIITTTVNEKVLVEQELFNMLSVNGSGNYYRLKKTKITAVDAGTLTHGTVIPATDYTMSAYDFTNLTLSIDGVDYVYSDHAPEDEYTSYYTVKFEKVIKEDKVNNNETWYNDINGYLDGSYTQYEGKQNQVEGYHANYAATLHKGKERKRSVTISSNWPSGKVAYPGARITLTAHPVGFGENVKYQWQRSTNRENWENIPDATGATFTYTLDNSTAQYFWRVVADE